MVHNGTLARFNGGGPNQDLTPESIKLQGGQNLPPTCEKKGDGPIANVRTIHRFRTYICDGTIPFFPEEGGRFCPPKSLIDSGVRSQGQHSVS
jgi:hypothetical protein